MKIEKGKSYRAKNGERWTAARPDGDLWLLDDQYDEPHMFRDDGTFYPLAGFQHDLVAEWTDADEPAPQPAAGPFNDRSAFFPASEFVDGSRPEIRNTYGMSLRDWFAGQALAGLGTWCPGAMPHDEEERTRRRAEWCVKQADAMIQALGVRS